MEGIKVNLLNENQVEVELDRVFHFRKGDKIILTLDSEKNEVDAEVIFNKPSIFKTKEKEKENGK